MGEIEMQNEPVRAFPLLKYLVSLTVIALVLFLVWPQLLQNLLSTSTGGGFFMPHGHCYLWVPSLVLLHLSTDFTIGVSYFVISITLAYLVYRARRDMPFHWIFIAFGLFIIACGATHLMEIWTLWNATYWLSGYVKLITATASAATAVVLPFIVPRALQLVADARESGLHRSELERLNEDLQKEIKARELAEEQQLEANETLHAIFRASPVGIFAVDGSGKVLIWNPAAERLFGRSEAAAVDHPLALNDFQETRERVLSGQTFADLELVRETREGSRIDLSMSTVPLRDANGAIAGVLAITADVTERNRAQEAERDTERKYRRIFDYAPMGIYQAQPDGTLTTVNTDLVQMLGYDSVPELLGRNLQRELFVTDGDGEPDLLLQPGGARDFEMRWRTKNGETIWVNLNSHRVADESGKTQYFDGFVFDISKRKRAEAELDAERSLIRTMFEQLPVGVLVRGFDNHSGHANETMAKILGLSTAELVTLAPAEIFTSIKAETVDGVAVLPNDGLHEQLLSNRHIEPQELHITSRAGVKRTVQMTTAPLTRHDGVAFGTVMVVADVTQQYVLEGQLMQSQKMESIGTLAGGVAHDFNNLLTVILGYTEMALRRHATDEKTQTLLGEVQKAGNRASSLTRQLLAFSRRQRLEMKTIYLNEIARDLMNMLQRIIGEDIEVHFKESAFLSPVYADPSQVQQVLLNLAVNARDAMPNGGEITITTQNVTIDEQYHREHPYAAPGDYVQLIVTDNGTGMDEVTRQRIFEPFFTTKEVGRGTGLGLSMVYGIVKQHNGIIEVESGLGSGSSFYIYLPAQALPLADALHEKLPTLRGGSETILVAEDEESLRGLTRATLEPWGYTILLAKDGLEAISLYLEHRESISLLLFDLIMPKLGGGEAYEQILALGHKVPALFMTGYSVDIVQDKFVTQNKFLERTGSQVIQKPYTSDYLVQKVREVLDGTGQ
jgi:two-component system cell cycle sensor histidine kinase/response regulator CckA